MQIVVMAGGRGTRFWPASRASKPKQFLSVIGSRSLVEQTILRVSTLTEERNVWVIINEDHRPMTEELLRGRNLRIVAEPVGRNTAPCIGLAAIHLQREVGEEPMVILPADHFVVDEGTFCATLRAAAKLAESGGIVTIGLTPTRPETGYGYLLKGPAGDDCLSYPVFQVAKFVEKPDLETAYRYLTAGNYLWNSGIFVFTPNTILQEIREHLPGVHQGLMMVRESLGRAGYSKTLREVYAKMPTVSLDYGIMEKTDAPVYVLPGNFDWSDIGSWDALYQLRGEDWDSQDNLSEGRTLLIDTKRSFVYSSTDRLVTTLGLTGVLIVDTSDGILVADLKKSQDVREVIRGLEEKGWEDYL